MTGAVTEFEAFQIAANFASRDATARRLLNGYSSSDRARRNEFASLLLGQAVRDVVIVAFA